MNAVKVPVHGAQDIQLAFQTGLLWQYVKNTALYYCPLDKTNATYFKQRTNKMSTYVANGALCGYGDIAPRSFHQVDFRQDCFITWEPDNTSPTFGVNTYNDGSSYPDPTTDFGLGRRHSKDGGIVTVVSGSVQFLKFTVWAAAAKDPNKNQLWCNPGTANGH